MKPVPATPLFRLRSFCSEPDERFYQTYSELFALRRRKLTYRGCGRILTSEVTHWNQTQETEVRRYIRDRKLDRDAKAYKNLSYRRDSVGRRSLRGSSLSGNSGSLIRVPVESAYTIYC